MPDPAAWAGRRVLVTGHTGFKGAWLSLWLARLGARVTGLAAPPSTRPSLFAEARVADVVDHVEGDVRDRGIVAAVVERVRPDVVFHLAGRSRRGEDPASAFETDVIGTAQVLDACRDAVVVCATSDRCYTPGAEPRREGDPLGGADPQCAAKASQEHVCTAFREAHGVRVATVRAGNVIGGGDWAADRLIPAAARAADAGEVLEVRAPAAVRPWQHVLEPLSGYLMLAEQLREDPGLADAWNFGPCGNAAWTVRAVVERLREGWGGRPDVRWATSAAAEAPAPWLDAQRARDVLGWAPRWNVRAGLAATVSWYDAHRHGADARALVHHQIEEHQRT